MLLQHRRALREAGWEVRVYGSVAKHEHPVEQLPVHFTAPRLSAYEYYWRFVRANPRSVLIAYDEPGVAMLAPSRSIIRFSWPGALPRYWRFPWALKRFQKANYLFPSHTARTSWCQQHLDIPPEQTHVIWNAVDLGLFSPRRGAPNRCRVGFAGQWTTDKGLDVLMTAWDIVCDRLPHAELWVAGGPDLWQRTVPVPPNKMVSQKTIASLTRPKVRVVGVLPRDQMPSFWASVDLACVPPIWEEQFGLVALEAIACGVPVVATRSGALPEIVGDAGLIVPKGEPEALAEAIVEMLRSPARLLGMGERARQRATIFSPRDSAAELVRLVETVARGV